MKDENLFIFLELGGYHYEADEKIKAEKAGPLFKEILPFILERLDAQAERNNGYLAIGRVSTLLKNHLFIIYYASLNQILSLI